MKLKTLSFIAGVITLTLATTPFIVKAQTNPDNNQPPATEVPEKSPWKKLGITDAQKSQLQTIRRNTRAQIEGVLNPEQLAKFKAANPKPDGEGSKYRGRYNPRKNFAELGLTDDQKAKIKEIMRSSKEQMQSVFTPEQQEQMKKFRNDARSRRQQGEP
jgi:protein CpxP